MDVGKEKRQSEVRPNLEPLFIPGPIHTPEREDAPLMPDREKVSEPEHV